MLTRSPVDTEPLGVELMVGAGAQVVVLAALLAGAGLGMVGWLAGTAYGAVSLALLATAARRAGSPALGAANRVTLIRMVLVGGVTAIVVDSVMRPPSVPALVALAAVALLLDGVDGRVARRTGTVSALGARFDMEVDAFLILVLSVFVAGSLGAWVLAIGAMRYAFGLAGWLAPWLRAPLPTSVARKAVAAFQGIALTVAGAGVVSHTAAFGIVLLALAALVWSFGRDIGWLWRRIDATIP